MLLSTNLRAYYEELGLEEMLSVYSDAGYGAIDFSLNIDEFIGGRDDAFFIKARETVASYGLTVGQTHAPFPSNFQNEAESEARRGEIIESIKYTALLGAPYIVIHPLKPYNREDEVCPEEFYQRNLAFFRSLLPCAKKYGVGIAIENCVGSLTRTSATLCRLMRDLRDESFSVCFDVGHANYAMYKYPALGLTADGMIRELGEYITCTHFHDNDGTKDAHTLPFYGNIDWDAVCLALADIGYGGNINFEASNFADSVPISLRGSAAKYMVSVGMHLIDNIRAHKK